MNSIERWKISVKLVVFMLGLVVFAVPAWALPSLVLSGNTQTFYEGQSEMFVDSGVVVSGNATDVIDGVRILIVTNYVSTTDLLLCANPLGFTVSFDSTKGILAIDGAGNIQDYQTVLRNVKYKNTQGNITATSLKNITMSLGKLLAFKGPDHNTYHYYQFVAPSPGLNWTAAKNAAAASTHFGLQGYLITVTSAEENAFAFSKFNKNIWIGASDIAVEGTWKWVTGPESGNVFWMGKSTGTSVGGYYENWDTGEPNDYSTGEDFAHFWATKNGLWNDYPHGNLLSYIIEYGGMLGDPDINLVDSVLTTVQENRTPTDISLYQFAPGDLPPFLYEDTNPPNWNAKIWVTDPDYDAVKNPTELHDLTFESSGLYPDNNKFSLSGNAYIGYTLTATGVFDYETQTSAHIRLRATEINGEKKHVKIEIVIPIENINEPPSINPGLTNITVNEDVGLLTQSITLIDPDTVSANLIVAISGDNTALVSASNLTISGTGNTRTVSMTPTANAYGTTVITLSCKDGEFNADVTSTMTLSVNPVNDAPTHSTLSAVTINEDASTTFTGAQQPIVSDIDIGASNLEISLFASHGRLSLSQLTGLTFSAGDGVSDANIIFQGNLAAVNSALNGLSYVPEANYYGPDSFVWKSSDLGNFGSGGVKSVITTVALTMTSINDAPILNVVSAIDLPSFDEDSPAGSGNTWQSILDNASAILRVDNDSADPASFVIVGSDNQSLGQWQTSVDGGLNWSNLPAVSVSSALLLQAQHRFRFVSNTNAFGQGNLIVKAWDASNALAVGSLANTSVFTASGAYSSNILVIQQSVRSMNDAPSWTMPSTVSTNEDVPVTLGAMVLDDIDIGSSSANVNVTVWNGTLTLAANMGLTFRTGDGVSDNNMVFAGNISNIKLALAASQFIPTTNFNGTALVQVSGNDLGVSGFGGAYASTASTIILTSEINDPPTINLSVNLAFVDQFEDQATAGNRIKTVLTSPTTQIEAYDDVDRLVPTAVPLPDGAAISAWASTNGIWQYTTNGGGVWSNFPTDDGRSFLLRDDSATLIRFMPLFNYYGTESLKLRGWDMTEGTSATLYTVTNPGNGISAFSGNQSTIQVKILPRNDAPQIFTPASAITTNEDFPVVFSNSGNALSLYDVESFGANVALSLNIYSTQGNVTAASLSGITSVGGGANLTLSGNLSDLNRALNGLQWQPYRDYFGTTPLLLTLNDQDTTQGLPLTTSANLTLQVLPVNDLPTLGPWSVALTYAENNPLKVFLAGTFGVIDVDDTYLQSAQVQITQNLQAEDILSVTATNTIISSSYNSTSGILSLSGVDTVGNYQSVINSLTFDHLLENPDREGTAPTRQLLVTAFDALGSSNLQLQMTILAINDAPQITSWNSTPSYKEDDIALVLDSSVVLTDLDNTFLQSVSVQLNPIVTGDTLSANATGNITVNWNSGTGTITLSGPAKPAEFTGVLQGLAYVSTSSYPDQNGANPTRTCLLSASDATLTTTSNITLTVQSFNDAPSLTVPFSLSGLEDQTLDLSTSPIVVVDADDLGADLKLSLEVTHGKLSFITSTGLIVLTGSVAGDNVLVVQGNKAALNVSLLGLRYISDANYNGNDVLHLVINDLGHSGTGGALDYSTTIPINLSPVNDAPVLLSGKTCALNGIAEDETNTAGNTVTSLLTFEGNLLSSDVDTGAGYGIAVTTNPSVLEGIWQYSLNAGGFWQDVPTVSFNAALLLDGDAMLRFVPNSNFNGSANLIFHSWDRSSGHSSGASSVSLGATGGQSAYSVNTGELKIAISAVNDPPILTVPPLQTLKEDNSKIILGLSVQDVDLAPTDTIQVTMSVGRGTLSVNGSLSQSTVVLTSSLSAVNQLLLTGVTYAGLANDHGTVSFNIVASDLGQLGSGGVQTATGLVILNIDEVNDAPVLNTAFWSDNILMSEDDTDHPGWAPAIWSNFNSLSIGDVDLNAGDNVWKNDGVAFTSLGSEVQGRWEYSINSGAQWTTVPTIASGNAFLLSLQGEHRLRFVPAANANGNVQIKYRAWDRNVGIPGEVVTINGTGGVFAYSTSEKTLLLEVLPVNDAPSILAATLPQTANEDENVVFRLSQVNGLRLEDVDLANFPSSICQLELSLSQANIQFGALTGLQILSGNIQSTKVRVSGNITDLSNALNGLTLTPFKDWYGKDTLTITFYDLGQIGSESLFHKISLDIIFLPVNDPPQWLKLDGEVSSFTEGDLFANLDVGNDLDILDVDSSDFMGGRFEVTGIEQGTRNDRLIILTDSDLATTGGNLSYQGNLMGTWKDVSQSQAALNMTFSTNFASLEAVKALAKNIRYTNASQNPSSGTRRFKWVLDDGDGGQARADVSLKVAAVNNDPTFVLDSGNTQLYTEDQGNWSIFSSNVRLSDPDSLDFSSGIFVLEWIEGRSSEDTWKFTASGNFSQVGTEIRYLGLPFASILSSNVGDTVFKCQWLGSQCIPDRIVEMLPLLVYRSDSQKPDVHQRVLKMSMSDGDGGLSSSVRIAFYIQAVNDAPVLQLGGALAIPAILEDTTNSLGWSVQEILATESGIVSDVDADPVVGLAMQLLDTSGTAGKWEYRLEEGPWQSFTASSSTNLLLLRDRDRLRFTPKPDWFGAISSAFTVRAWDRSTGFPAEWKTVNFTGTTTAFSVHQRTLSLTVTGVPDAPVVVNGQVNGAKYASRAMLWSEFSGMFSDVDGDTLQKVIVDVLPTHGDLYLNNVAIVAGQILTASDVANLVYVPRTTFTGVDSFKWRAMDTQGTSNTTSTFSINVVPVNANISLSQNMVNENVGTLKVSVTLSVASTALVRLQLQSVQETLVNYKDMVFGFGTVEFPAGSTLWEKVITIVDDAEVETTETMGFKIVQPSLCDIGTDLANLSVLDNDVAIVGETTTEAQVLVEWLDPAWVRETGTSARLALRLSQNPTGAVSLQLQSSDLSEGVLSTGLLQFNSSNWNIAQVVTVTGVADHIVDGNIKAAVVITPSISTYRAEPAVFTNIDMDSQGLVMLEALPLVTSEDGAQTMLLFTLQTQPAGNVLLTTVWNHTEHQLSTGNVFFTSEDWNSPHVLIIKGLDNAVVEGDRFVGLSWVKTESTDLVARGLSPKILDILQKDNDSLNPALVKNLPPYRLILNSNVVQTYVNSRVMIQYGAEDPEVNMGLQGGIVDYFVDLNTGSGFKAFEATQGATFAMNFKEAGVYTLKLRARDLLGAISLKQLTVVIQGRNASPFGSIPALVQTTSPATLTWNWKDDVVDAQESTLRLIEWDFEGDGLIDVHGFSSDTRLKAIAHRFDQAGQFDVLLRVMDASGEIFTQHHRVHVLASGSSDPVLSLVVNSDSNTSPSKVGVKANLSGTFQTISHIDWSFGEEVETPWDIGGTGLSVSHVYQKPGTYNVLARATLSNGQVIESRSKVVLNPPSHPIALWTGMSSRLPWGASVGYGFPLQTGVWPTQGTWESSQHSVTGQQGALTGSGIMGITLAQSESSLGVQSSARVTFNGQTRTESLSQTLNYRSDFISQQSEFNKGSGMALPWSGNASVFVDVRDGSSFFVPSLGLAQGLSASIQLLKDSGLTTQGVPSHLRSIYRDVRFVLSDGKEVEEPQQPLVLELAYDDIDQDGLVDGYGVSENDLVAMRFDHALNRWVDVEYYMTQPLNNVVRVKTAHLSEFGLFISGKRNVIAENNSGGGCLLK